MKTDYPFGAEWRRWDLHVHSPASVLNNGFGSDFDAYAKELFGRAVAAEIAAIGITDYFGIGGYVQLRGLLDDAQRLEALIGAEAAERASEILLLPNIEFRLDTIVRSPKGDDSRVNFHVMFSDEVSVDDIQQNFLSQMRFVYEAEPDSPDHRWAVTDANLAALGKRLKEEHSPFRDRSDAFIGAMNAVVSHEKITELLTDQPSRFKHRYVTLVAADEDLSEVHWNGQGHLARKILIKKSHMLFAASEGTRDFALGRKHADLGSYRSEFGRTKACVHGSDAHSFDGMFCPDQDRFLWVKADPTFAGLRQLIHEPEDRVFVGREPPARARVRNDATRYAASLAIERTSDEPASEKWFGGIGLPINPGLVAVIGRKGSGKSALADILGLCADSRADADFSFLSSSRFLNPKHGLAKLFRATLAWASGDATSKVLTDGVDHDQPERVQYLPQSHLERICTEIDDSGGTYFDAELEGVIYSHVSDPERLGFPTLQRLIGHRRAEADVEVTQLRGQLSNLNREVAELREELSERNQARLAAKVDEQKRRLDAHDRAEPAVPPEPELGEAKREDARLVAAALEAAVATIRALDAEIATSEEARELAHRRRVAIDRLLNRIANLEREVERFYEDSQTDLPYVDFDLRSGVVLTVDAAVLKQAAIETAAQISALEGAVDASSSESLVVRRKAASQQAEGIRLKLAEPARRREEGLRLHAVWERERAELVGSASDPVSLAGTEAMLAGLKTERRARLLTLIQQRKAVTKRIFDSKSGLLQDYGEFHRPVQEFIAAHDVASKVDALEFTASMRVDGLIDGIAARIHHGRRGSFQGEQEGRARLRALIERHDFSSADGVLAFLDELGSELIADRRSDPPAAVDLTAQLIKGGTPQGLYDYLFGLEYLRPRFELLWSGKPLSRLSPGERGTLLLIFFLLIDRRTDPLVIDQPEENLDNETIAELLVPAVRYAKRHRQVVMVTHNPNLAVVCDAEQIIHATIDKDDGNRIKYVSGSIENPTIARAIVNVLEGTKPAFDIRTEKYDVLDRLGA